MKIRKYVTILLLLNLFRLIFYTSPLSTFVDTFSIQSFFNLIPVILIGYLSVQFAKQYKGWKQIMGFVGSYIGFTFLSWIVPLAVVLWINLI